MFNLLFNSLSVWTPFIETRPPGLAFPRQAAPGEFFHKATTEDKFAVATRRVSRNENLVIGAQLSNESSQRSPRSRRGR